MGAFTHPSIGAREHAGAAGHYLRRRRLGGKTAEYSPEADFIQRVQRGDREAFTSLVHEHQSAIYGFLRARLVDGADAEDMCQEVFLRCYCGKVKFSSKVPLRPWLLGIARNVLREHVRSVKRRREIGWTETALMIDDWAAEQPQEADDATQHLSHCVNHLGPSARQALDLRYRGHLKLAEIGERLHRSEGAIKLLMYRARQALRSCLDRKLQTPADE